MVLGAGAAGLFCAGLLAQRGARVAVLDHAPAPGRKILVSGGGRANFTNLNSGPENFLSENPHFSKSALARYLPQQFVALVERYGIAYHEKTAGQLFCDGSARQIVEMLVAECQAAELRLGVRVVSVAPVEDGFCLALSGPGEAEEMRARALVVATGGLSIPKLGATAFGYELARQFGITVVPPRPALVPFTLGGADAALFADLSGIAFDSELALTPAPIQRRGRGGFLAGEQVRFRDRLLVTHRGISGPAALQISSYWRSGGTLTVDLAPEQMVVAPVLREPARRSTASVLQALAAALPRRLAERLLALAALDGLDNEALLALEYALHRWAITPDGTEGFAKAEVTAGGVSTSELNARSMEARKAPGMYFIGEVVDVTGQLGGFNFQWAWASAAAAAAAIVAA